MQFDDRLLILMYKEGEVDQRMVTVFKTSMDFMRDNDSLLQGPVLQGQALCSCAYKGGLQSIVYPKERCLPA